MAIQKLTSTTNFLISFENTIPNAAARAQAVNQVCEAEYSDLAAWFGISSAFGPTDRINVYFDQPDNSGAFNRGYVSGGESEIRLDVQSANSNSVNAGEIVRMLFVLELVEVFMSYNGQHGRPAWIAADSSGEALSHFCAIARFPTGHGLYYGSVINTWMQWPPVPCPGSGPTSPKLPTVQRKNWIAKADPTDRDCASYGCALLFLYYLHTQLGYTVPDIIQKAGATLEETYQNLTGTTGGFVAFSQLINQFFPIGNTRPFLNNDPFPLWDSTTRQLSLELKQKPIGNPIPELSGSASVKPLFFCPAKVYSFSFFRTPQTLTCVASTYGFGQPSFKWKVNGISITPAAVTTLFNVSAPLDVADLGNPQSFTTSSVPVQLWCSITPDALGSTLTITAPNVYGGLHLTVEVSAVELFASPDVTTTTETVTVHNQSVVWEPAYYKDHANCASSTFIVGINHRRVFLTCRRQNRAWRSGTLWNDNLALCAWSPRIDC